MIRPIALLLALLQSPAPPPAPTYPFAVGETLTYSAKLGMLTLGSGTLQVAALDSLRGHETFRFRFRLTGKTVFYKLDDVLESWVTTEKFDAFPGPSVNTMVFDDLGDRTSMTLTLAYPSREIRDGWVESGMTDGLGLGYTRLDGLLAREA